MTDNKTKVHNFINEKTKDHTPYSPTWRYCISEKKLDLDVEEFAKIIIDHRLKNQDFVIATFSNVLKWDHPVCKQLHKEIIEFHDQYVEGTVGKPPEGHPFTGELENLKVRCWSNTIVNGEEIGKHSHSSHPQSYLSGHFTIACEDTSTIYYDPYNNNEEYPIENEPNILTLFPTWVPHRTSLHTGDSPRITLAFDIFLQDMDLNYYDSYSGDNDRIAQNNPDEIIYLRL